jgi:Ca-activated chloride channel homolog
MATLESLSFAWPLAVLVLPLPWIIRRWLPPAASDPALRFPSLQAYREVSALAPNPIADRRLGSREHLVAAVMWLLLVVAVTRPQVADPLLKVPATGRELMIALDTSVSMGTQDMRLDGKPAHRLAVARALASRFVALREGDRVGLIVFGSQAYLHTPLSFDLDALSTTLVDVELGLAGRETALGDAIALAAKRMREHGDSARVLVLLTDGAHNAGELTPEQALWIAQREGIRIYTIGIGAESMRVVTPNGIREINPSADLDEDALRKIAEQTGGSYHRATDSESLAEFYRRIDALEPAANAQRSDKRPARELYPFPAALALLLGGWLIWQRARPEARK